MKSLVTISFPSHSTVATFSQLILLNLGYYVMLFLKTLSASAYTQSCRPIYKQTDQVYLTLIVFPLIITIVVFVVLSHSSLRIVSHNNKVFYLFQSQTLLCHQIVIVGLTTSLLLCICAIRTVSTFALVANIHEKD